ncbi:MAG: cysteine desulfurase-like protein [Acidobacteria bacterium]|nr:cysteine desulfurase-like protein [Candidatus Sulfomarinibacter kjeldsenii]
MTTQITNDDRQRIRTQFPALAGDTVYLENAGGSQVPAIVADSIRDYMLTSYVQLGAGYPLSHRATELVDEAHDFVRLMMNGKDGEVILGSSTTALLQMLAKCYAQVLEPGSEIVVAQTGHEANVGPWKMLDRLGFSLRWWEMDPADYTCPLSELENLLSDRTALVAFPHVSNLLGDIVDIEAITSLVHEAGARVVVDGVAYAPHRAIDVSAWNVDWYAYSTYKVYGPHMAALWGRRDALAELHGPNHFFVPEDDLPYKFEVGGANHEGCAGVCGLRDYLAFVVGEADPRALDRPAIEQAFEIMTACELPLQARLIEYLQSRKDVRIVGPSDDGDSRVGTISFVHESKSSAEITAAVDRSGIGIRHGHMYAYHLCEAAGLDPEDGVVRTSLVHYNTMEEIEKLIEVFDAVLE